MLTQSDIMWLAGWLEGEGWFGLSHGSISIQACSIDHDVLTRVASLLQTTHIYRKKPTPQTRHQVYVCRVCGETAANIMTTLLPYMGERRSKRIQDLLIHHSQRSTRKSAASTKRWADPAFRLKVSAAIRLARQGGGNQYTHGYKRPTP